MSRWSLISAKHEPTFWRLVFTTCNGIEAVLAWRRQIAWGIAQAWGDHRCACFGHTRRLGSGYCAVCRRFQVGWLIEDGALALAQAVDQRVFDIGPPRHARRVLPSADRSTETKATHGMWIEPPADTDPVICDLLPRDADVFTDEDVANARLIAAAPELLAAVKDQRCSYCGFSFSAPRGDCQTCAPVIAAIAKAEGQ